MYFKIEVRMAGGEVISKNVNKYELPGEIEGLVNSDFEVGDGFTVVCIPVPEF